MKFHLNENRVVVSKCTYLSTRQNILIKLKKKLNLLSEVVEVNNLGGWLHYKPRDGANDVDVGFCGTGIG